MYYFLLYYFDTNQNIYFFSHSLNKKKQISINFMDDPEFSREYFLPEDKELHKLIQPKKESSYLYFSIRQSTKLHKKIQDYQIDWYVFPEMVKRLKTEGPNGSSNILQKTIQYLAAGHQIEDTLEVIPPDVF